MNKTAVIIPNETLPKKCSECFAFNEEGGCNLYSLGIPGRYSIGSLDTRPEWCELEEKDDEFAAFSAAVVKKLYGSNSAVTKIIKKKTFVQEKKESQ